MKKDVEKTVVCLMGPTASGKTEIAVELVRHDGFEIVNVDSAQVYKYMDIGTAKPDADTLKIAPHRLLDFLDPASSYSVGKFLKDVEREIKVIQQNGNLPLLVGGSMMYFNALQTGLASLPDKDEDVRASLQKRQEAEGLQSLYAELKTIDPRAAKKINTNDSQRIIRALEVYLISGKTLTELQNRNHYLPDYTFYNFGLLPDDRASLYQKIEKRFDVMLDQGFVDEVKYLYNRGDLKPDMPAMRSVGYRQVWKYLAGEYKFATMREKGIIATRQLAKRQLTWLRSWNNLLKIKNHDEILRYF